MVRRSSRKGGNVNADDENDGTEELNDSANDSSNARNVPSHIRERQRAVAEREAARLARPERRMGKTLDHADRKKSAVSSTPFGILRSQETGENSNENDNDQGWCGPFSVARQMIAKREEERRKREAEMEDQEEAAAAHPLDMIVDQLAMERKRKAHPSLQWKSRVVNSANSESNRPTSAYAKRQKRLQRLAEGEGAGAKIPSLFQLCVNFVVSNFEYVESLGYVDNDIRSTIAKELVGRNKLDEQAFAAIAEPGIEALEMVDCTGVSQDQLSKTLKKLLPAGLRYLALDQAGRCFGLEAVKSLLLSSAKSKSELFALSIGGAYLLKDTDAAKILQTFAPTLSNIEFKACPLLGQQFANSIGRSFSKNGTGTLLELSLEDLNFNNESIAALTASPDALKNIQSLTLRRIGGLDDDVVVRLLEIVGEALEALDLSNNYNLTDVCLAPIRKSNPVLRALHLEGLKCLTAAGLEALFTVQVEGLGPPPMLRSLNLASCHYESVTDDVLELALRAASMKRATTASTVRNASNAMDNLSFLGGIVQLNIQGSHAVTDTTMENLVSTASSSLQELNISFCPKISDQGLGYLVDKLSSNQLRKINIWGCAQISDEFLDGHSRVHDPTLEIAGAWIKKTGKSSMR